MQARSALALPREVSRAVFQLTDSSLTPAASQSWGSSPLPQMDTTTVTAKCSRNGVESEELFLEANRCQHLQEMIKSWGQR